MSKLVLKQSKLQSLNDSESIELSNFHFELSQFNIPSQMVVLKDDIIVRAEKIKNSVGELTETGRFNLTFKVYDRPFIEMVINNNGTEIGSPITIVVEGYENNHGFIAGGTNNDLILPQLSGYEDGEFIPISFENIKVTPKKIEKKAFAGAGKPMVNTWAYADLKISGTNFFVGETIEPKAK